MRLLVDQGQGHRGSLGQRVSGPSLCRAPGRPAFTPTAWAPPPGPRGAQTAGQVSLWMYEVIVLSGLRAPAPGTLPASPLRGQARPPRFPGRERSAWPSF